MIKKSSYIRDYPFDFLKRQGIFLHKKQRLLFDALFYGKQRVLCKSANAVGKTYFAAAAVNYFLNRYPHSIVLTTAPTWRQVEQILWREIRTMNVKAKVPFFPNNKILNTKIDLAPDWYAIGISSNEETHFQGFHSKEILIIVDEGNGVADKIYNAIQGSMTGNAFLLVIGNPIIPQGFFFKSFGSDLYEKITITAFDSPNITGEKEIRGLADKRWIEERKVEWGPGTPIYISRVEGEFADQTEWQLIPLLSIEYVSNYAILNKEKGKVLGVDVARKGGDESVIIELTGMEMTNMWIWKTNSTTELSGYIIDWYKQNPDGGVAIDDIGVGGGVVDECIDAGVPVDPFIASGSPNNKDIYASLKAESFYQLKNSIEEHKLSIINDDVLKLQLRRMQYGFSGKGKIRVIDPDDSPDRADALNIAHWIQNNKIIWSTK